MQTHRRSLLFLMTLLGLGGLAVSWTLPVALFPNVDFPRVVVSLDAEDRPAERMALEVTRPVEDAVRSVPGVRNIRSTSSRGSSEISINFDWDLNMVSAMLQVESAINQILPTLPQGTSFDVRRMDPTVFPALAYSLTSDTLSPIALRDLAYFHIRPLFSAVRGVSKVEIMGGGEEEYRVTVDPDRLLAHKLGLDDVAKALSAANVITAVGHLEDHYKLFLVLADSRFDNVRQIGDTILLKGANGIVRLEDVATVARDVMPTWTRVTADGHDAVLLEVRQQPGGNTVQIARDLKAQLAAFQPHLPADVKVANWYDQSELIVASATSVRDAVVFGVILACVVLILFLRNTKITAIAMVCVPAVLATTVLLLKVLHMSFNIMTLGGMAAAVGLIIDDAIVMVEHIIRRLRGHPGAHHGLVLSAAAEFTVPLVASSASTIIIFAPLPFLSGVTGAFFKALSLTMAASLLVSLLIALLAVPILADHFLDEKDAEQEEGGAFTAWLHGGYERCMRRLLGRPALVLFGVAPLLLLGWVGYERAGSGFMPEMDEGGFIVDYWAAPGTSLAETDRLLRHLEDILHATPDVKTYSRRTGLQLGGFLTEAYTGDIFVRLKAQPRRDIDEVMDEIRAKVEKKLPGLEIEMSQLMEDEIGDLTAVPQPIEIKLFCEDGAILSRVAPRVAGAIGAIRGVVDVRDGIVLAGDALNIDIDRVKVALEGMDPAAVTQSLSDMLAGKVTTQMQKGSKMVGVRMWIPADRRASVRDVGDLQIRAPDGHLFPLKRVAAITTVTGQPEIMSENLQRMVAVTGRITGRDMGSAIRDVRRALLKPGLLPREVYFTLGGTYAEQQSAFAGLIAVFGAAVALVFFLLLFLYERFRVAVAMMLTTLLALAAVMIGLWVTRTEINISSMMGMTMIVGIATEVAIFLVSELMSLPGDGDPVEALIRAGKNRMRPIAMTTLAAILALLPLALGLGQGSSMQQPLAIAIISGLVAQLPLVLIVLPVALSLLHVRWNTATSD